MISKWTLVVDIKFTQRRFMKMTPVSIDISWTSVSHKGLLVQASSRDTYTMIRLTGYIPLFRCPVFPTSHFSDVPLFRNFKLNVQISNFFFIWNKNCNRLKEFEINENFKYFPPTFLKMEIVSKVSNNILPNSKFVTKYYFDNKNSSIWNFPHFLKFYAQKF